MANKVQTELCEIESNLSVVINYDMTKCVNYDQNESIRTSKLFYLFAYLYLIFDLMKNLINNK